MRAALELFFHLLGYMFGIGFIACLVSVIPITAYRLFSVLFEKDIPEDQ